METLKNSWKILSIICLFCSMNFVSCSSDDEKDGISNIPEDFFGIYTRKSGNSWIYYSFYKDGTGIYSVEANSYSTETPYVYTIKGNTIYCKGVYTSVDNDGDVEIDENWSTTATYENGTIIINSHVYTKAVYAN